MEDEKFSEVDKESEDGSINPSQFSESQNAQSPDAKATHMQHYLRGFSSVKKNKDTGKLAVGESIRNQDDEISIHYSEPSQT